MADRVGFEPTVELPLLLISSQVPLTAQPPVRTLLEKGKQYHISLSGQRKTWGGGKRMDDVPIERL